MHVRLFAIDITRVRGWFGSSPEVAARLRQVASERFRSEVVAPRSPGLLGRLGPLFGRDPWAPVVEVGQPTLDDVEALVTGRFLPPERLDAAWRVVEAWLDAESAASGEVTASGAQWQQAEMALAAAGLPSVDAPSRLWRDALAVPLRPCEGLAAGFCPATCTPGMHARLLEVRPGLDADTLVLVDALEPTLAVAARDGLDVVALSRA